jgi:AraC-like DNA-binding protein
MYWTLSEFLNVFEFRSQCWCFVNLGADGAVRMPHAEAVHFYAVTEGQVRIARIAGETVELREGEIAFVLSEEAHAVRHQENARPVTIPLLQNGGFVDVPPTISLGNGPATARMLCGRLKVRWPGGQRPRGLPGLLKLDPGESVVNLERLVGAAKGEGACALLTRLASLLFVNAFRSHPQCQALFSQSGQLDPIARAQQFIELHPFHKWTVEVLARKVGMGRSNFAARFAAQTGKTPIDVLTEERMKHAAEFLAKTDLKIAEISERVGYRSEAAFHHRFTSFFGMSPGQLRRQRQQMRPKRPALQLVNAG